MTISDRCSRGEQADLSGPVVRELLESAGASVVASETLPDEVDPIAAALRHHAKVVDLIVTTGGTGLAPRDVTPEATRAVCDRILDGFAELMRAEGRKQTQFAPLSRSVSGTRGRSLIVSLPGSPAGAKASLESVISMIPHALNILEGTVSQDHDHGAEEKHPGTPA